MGRDESRGLLLERRRGEPQCRGKEGRMREEQRQGRNLKAEKRKRRNLHVMGTCAM